MTTKELLSFKKAFTKSKGAAEAKPQFKPDGSTDLNSISQFKI